MTGASGLVGSRFVEMFSDKYEIFNMDLKTGVDITKLESLENFINTHPASSLIHLAAFTNTGDAFKQNGDKEGICYQVNVLGTQNIAHACKAHGIHLLHVSTDFVFNGTKETPYKEEDPRTPIEWYGETKAMAEEEVENSGCSYTIVRIAYPYRANFADKPDILAKIRSGLESGSLFPQFTDTTITPTFIDDISRGFDKVIELKPSGIYHFTGSSSVSPYDLALSVAQAYKFDPSLVKKGSLTEYLKNNPRPFARFAAIDNTKAKQELGLEFANLSQGIQEVITQQNQHAHQI